MIQKFGERLLSQLEENLRMVDLSAQPMVVFREQAKFVSGAIKELEAHLVEHPFDSLPAEVWYFKELLPRFRSWQLYFPMAYKLRMGVPIGEKKLLRKYYQVGLGRISAFFARNGFHYDYYNAGFSQFDALFYSLSGDVEDVLQPVLEVPFCSGTLMSGLVARFMALERFRGELLAGLHALEGAPAISVSKVTPSGELVGGLKWTGEVIHLIELAHGIYLTGQVNSGDIGIVEFFKVLGDFFGVNLRVPKRGFDDLKSRKTMSRTYFLDRMQQEILKKMDDEDVYDPEKQLRRKGFF